MATYHMWEVLTEAQKAQAVKLCKEHGDYLPSMYGYALDKAGWVTSHKNMIAALHALEDVIITPKALLVHPDPACHNCHGRGLVTDWVPMPFGHGNTAMESYCTCIEEKIPSDYNGEVDLIDA